MKTEMEFEIVCKPTPGKPGIMRAKGEKSLEEQLIEACRKFLFREFGRHGEPFAVTAERTITARTYPEIRELARILLAIDARKKEKDPSKVYRSDIHLVSEGCSAGWVECRVSGKPYYQYRCRKDGNTRSIFSYGNFVCHASEVVEDVEEEEV